jgi:hypothetical protein
MSINRMLAMTRDANQYLAGLDPASDRQKIAAKILGLLLWYLTELATSPAARVSIGREADRLWEAIMAHMDAYLDATEPDAINTILICMSVWNGTSE